MSVMETAEAFTALLKEGKHEEAAARFNAENIVSLEPMDGPMARSEGAQAVKAKAEWWFSHHEVHSATAKGPLVHGNQFIVNFAMDVTIKESGQRFQAEEAGLYTVKDGKIVEERFFMAKMGG